MLKNWLLNIALAIAGIAVVIWLVFIWMNWYTRHNVFVDVPNVKGINAQEAIQRLETAGLRYEVFDSVYNEDFKKNAISEQEPTAGSKVKPNRIIYLTINALAKPKVKMPKLADLSLTLGTAILKNAGFTIGEIRYVWDEIGHNLIMDQLYKGQTVPPGKLLDKGSTIDLIVATNRRNFVETDSLNIDSEPGDEPIPNKNNDPKK